MSLRLSRRPGSVVFLDDDPDYLEPLTRLLPRHRPLRLFQSPAQCIQHLRQEQRLHEAPIDCELSPPDRAVVCVVDFTLQGMDGLQVFSELPAWRGARMLLADNADERIARGAQSRGLIDRYLLKHELKLPQRLAEAIEEAIEAQ